MRKNRFKKINEKIIYDKTKDPRYYNNGEIVKLEKGSAPSFKTKQNYWMNSYHPVLVGRGNF